jgi:alkylation response protein AidB-like acyl-CoA dehydrogenase
MNETTLETGAPAGVFSMSPKLLERCHERAAGYDRENRFFQEDYDELKAAGYLLMAVPKEFGGYGMSLIEVNRVARKLAYYAPATALAMNMHHYWIGLAADLWRAGDKSVEWMLAEAGKGEVFAAGHAEPGNDIPLLLSTTKAEPVKGGYRITGRKSFGSLSPVWTYLGVHAMDASDPKAPKIVHAFLPRKTEGLSIKETWDVMGMRATRSDDTVLENVFVPDQYVTRVVPAGAAGIDHFVLGIFAWALINFANIYYGLATRMRDITIEALKTKTSLGMTRSMAYHPMVQHGVAEMVLQLEAVLPQIEAVAQDWSNTIQHGPEFAPRIIAAKYNAVEAAFRVADRALDLSGGFGMFKKSELERLFRDCRAGRFHPVSSNLAHEFLAKLTLGINPDEQPRWG